MAVKLVGLELHRNRTNTTGGGFSWLVQAYVSRDESVGSTTDIREILPEEIMYEVYRAIGDEFKCKTLAPCIEKMAATGPDRLLPGHPISVIGVLTFAELGTLKYDPFAPPDINMKTFQFHGEECFVGELQGDGYRIPVYFPKESMAQVAFSSGEPVEITGIVRWSPPYSPKGARSLSLAIRVAALWLR
jgi:hypothetical protein